MNVTTKATRARRAPARSLPLVLALGCLAFVVGLGAMAGAGDAHHAKTLGKTNRTPRPNCPRQCRVEGQVTGFQQVADGKHHVMVAPENGRLIAWSVDLSKPSKKQRKFFSDLFQTKTAGGSEYAKIAVLRKVGGKKYKLLRQSPKVDLKSSMGDVQYVTLGHPLRISKGDILALTVPTWISNFVWKVPSSDGFNKLPKAANHWRGSRSKDNCAPNSPGTPHQVKEFVRKSKPQNKVGSIRRYGCNYTGARLLYWGYYVPK
jgi:hypothetical protein